MENITFNIDSLKRIISDTEPFLFEEHDLYSSFGEIFYDLDYDSLRYSIRHFITDYIALMLSKFDKDSILSVLESRKHLYTGELISKEIALERSLSLSKKMMSEVLSSGSISFKNLITLSDLSNSLDY